MLDAIKGRKKLWLKCCMQYTQGNVTVEILEWLVNEKRNRGRRRVQMLDDIRTVSYTHLDVYKRQT